MLDWLAHPCYVNVHMASLRVRGQIMFAQTYKLPWKSGTQIRIEILKDKGSFAYRSCLMQWAAVSTCLAVIRVPPHLNGDPEGSSYPRSAIQGHAGRAPGDTDCESSDAAVPSKRQRLSSTEAAQLPLDLNRVRKLDTVEL